MNPNETWLFRELEKLCPKDYIFKSNHFLAELSFKPYFSFSKSQSAFTCSKLPTETLEQGVKYVQS